MGIEIDRVDFDTADRQRFSNRLDEQLAQLRALLERPGFGVGPSSMGAELELYIVDEQGRTVHCNQELCEAAADPQLTLELNRYNLEYNLSPQGFAAEAFSATEREISTKLNALTALAADRGCRVVPIGILPTLRADDFGSRCITDRRRYHAMVKQLIQWRGSDFHIDINGADPLQMALEDITLEGANTSFQVHLRVPPEAFAATFNAMQLITPLVVAISANSPGIFGHELWDETRIPLFKQSIDTRQTDRYRWHEPARVNFGHGWVREGAFELFEQTVRLYPPLLPICGPREGMLEPGQAPELAELRLHQGTVWSWNRAVYDDVDGGHLRIEMRALPAGPTAVDMVAGAALTIGLAWGLREHMDALLPAMPFALAEYNFYRGAQHGLAARLVWPDARQHGLHDRKLTDILESLLPTADAGLAALGVGRDERNRYLGVIDARLAARRNGAAWQRSYTQQRQAKAPSKQAALSQMLARYRELSSSNMPVAEWPL